MKSTLIVLFLIVLGLAGCKVQNLAVGEVSEIETAAIDRPKSVTVRGNTMHYIEKGSGEPVILIHGAIGDYTAWGQQIDALALTHRAIAISRRYAWPNQQPNRDDSFDCTVALHSNDLAAFMEALDIPSAHLIGHSYGAMIALRTAIDHPELVNSLVLGEPVVESLISGTHIGDSVIADTRISANLAVSHYEAGRDEAAMRTFIKMVFGSDESYDAVPQAWRDKWLQNLVEGICIAETQDMASLARKDIAQLNIPSLLIEGEYSPAIFRLVTDSLNAILPNSELKVLSKASHGLQGENPVEFNRAVGKFLRDNPIK